MIFKQIGIDTDTKEEIERRARKQDRSVASYLRQIFCKGSKVRIVFPAPR